MAGGAGQWKMLIRDMAILRKRRRTWLANGDACPSWDGMKDGGCARLTSRCSAAWSAMTAPFQIEAAEVGQPLEAATLEHRAALAGVVKLTIADKVNMQPTKAQHVPRASLSISMLGPQVPHWWWHAADLHCRRRTTVAGDLRAAPPRFRRRPAVQRSKCACSSAI